MILLLIGFALGYLMRSLKSERRLRRQIRQQERLLIIHAEAERIVREAELHYDQQYLDLV